ncbi:hypothetical protein SOVF_163390 [Spinacia oleracea]|uniref:Poly(A) polymerase n=1 Tax=Spinacia oleracea TaxID=3562 RepID=A0A9R0K4K0_SPIOL|nr:nuclear poly(A) polymerase 3-like [Spinacia oleracea]KNA08338.1 hypothetical protein SOVF_163390 [Spinacia oleracea]
MANAYNQRGGRVAVTNSDEVVGCVPLPYFLVRTDFLLSISLLQFMANEGLVPSPDETLKRRSIVLRLEKIVQDWITKVAWQRKRPENGISNASAGVIIYGSYGLGVHNSESDIDALCFGPFFATMEEDFFIGLHNVLKSTSGVSKIHCVKDAKVPLMRFIFEGIAVDMPYARLPENVDMLSPMLPTSIDETTLKILSGVRVNKRILQLVPHLENFQSLLRCVKFWAKQRGVYGHLFGFLGGIHLAILSAFICQTSPDFCLSALVLKFFNTFANWPWPIPVVLQGNTIQVVRDVIEKGWMPIRMPCSPSECCQSNVTRSTFTRIMNEFLRGHKLTMGILQPDFEWVNLFEPYSNMYRQLYSRFLKIDLLACAKDNLGDWIGRVKSRFPSLILKLEEMNVLCDPNPTEYVDQHSGNVDSKKSVVFYWGLGTDRPMDINVTSLEKDFRSNLSSGYRGMPGKMKLSIVPASELPNIVQLPKTKRMEACWRVPEHDQYRMPNSFTG